MEKEKQSYHHGDLKRALVDASLRLIREEGIEGLSLRKVAQLAGVTHAAPYAHFADKAALISTVKEEGFRELESRLEASLKGAPKDPRKRIQRVGMAYLKFAASEPTRFQLMFHHPLPKELPGFGYVQAGVRTFALIEREFAGLFAQLGLPAAAARRTAFAGWAMVHGMISLWIGGPLVFVYEEATSDEGLLAEGKKLIDLLLHRLIPTPH